MKYYEENFKILSLHREKNSYYGNPKWTIAIETIDRNYNCVVIAKTLTDGAIGYQIGTYSINKIYKIKYHFNQKYETILDYIIKEGC